MILDAKLDADQYILLSLYNANIETEQCKIFNTIFDINQNKRIIFVCDFNTFFTSKPEVMGGKLLPKRKSIIKLVDIKQSLDICDIWRIRNAKRQNFTFRNNNSSGFIEHRLDFNSHQEFVNYTDILPTISTDHPP